MTGARPEKSNEDTQSVVDQVADILHHGDVDEKPWYRQYHILRLNFLMVRTNHYSELPITLCAKLTAWTTSDLPFLDNHCVGLRHQHDKRLAGTGCLQR